MALSSFCDKENEIYGIRIFTFAKQDVMDDFLNRISIFC